jgi:hypothetical protein
MTATYSEATDTMNSLLYALLVAESASIIGYIPEVYWPTIELPRELPVNRYWLRVARQTVLQRQANIAGADLVRKYTTRGLLSIQVFAPMLQINSARYCCSLAQLAQRAYRGVTTPNGVWFRDVTVKELPADGRYYRCNVVSDFQYDEVG